VEGIDDTGITCGNVWYCTMLLAVAGSSDAIYIGGVTPEAK
jgi:hypothetical protein